MFISFFDGDIFRLTTDLLSEISCGITEDITKTTTTQGICPLEVNASIGNKLSVVGDEIIVGPGVSFVEISGSMLGHADTDTPTSTQAYIKHNGNSIATGRDLATTTDKYTYVALPTFLFPVNEGDKITLTWWKSNTTNFTIKKGSATQITVKAIA